MHLEVRVLLQRCHRNQRLAAVEPEALLRAAVGA
jgi:hypothetical protein